MSLLKVATAIALVSIPFALAEAGNSRRQIPLLSLLVVIPHLITIFAPKRLRSASIGIAIESSLFLFVGLTINTLLSLVRLFPVSGSSVPWLCGAAAHGAMFVTAILARRGQLRSVGDVAVGLAAFCYSMVSVVLVQATATFLSRF